MADVRDINLLPFEEKAQERFEQLVKRLSKISVVFLAATAIFTLVTLFFFTSLVSKRSELISKIESASNTINSYKASEELIVVVKNKVGVADKVLALRIEYPSVFETFSKLVPQGVYFTDVKVASDKVTISGKAKTSADVAGLVSSLLSAEGTKVISAISVDSLNSDEVGTYSFVISGKLPKS